MQIIKNIQFNYYLIQLKDLIKNSKFTEIQTLFLELNNKNQYLLFQLLCDQFNNFISIRRTDSIFQKNIIFLNSFIMENNKIISDFLKFYFQKNPSPFLFNNFNDLFLQSAHQCKLKSDLNFQNVIDNSVIFQIMWSLSSQSSIRVLENEFAFFSTPQNFNFCDSATTNCYFIILDHPYNIYAHLKNKLGNERELALNIMFNLDDRPEIYKKDTFSLEVIKKGYAIHTKSWRDANVTNSMRGHVVDLKTLIDDPLEGYSKIILHLINSGNKIKLNYDLIEEYVNNNPISNNITDQSPSLSNNEKKFIQKQFEQLAEELDFDFENN